MTDQKADLLEQKTSLLVYLASKLKAGDMHAVQDAASDIREIDAKLEVLVSLEVPSPRPAANSLDDVTIMDGHK